MRSDEFYCMHSELCKTLANPRRQQILDTLRGGEVTVGEVAQCTGMTQANVSQHLALMRRTGVVTTRREGTRVHYALADRRILQAFDLISEVMRDSLGTRNRAAGGIPAAQTIERNQR